MGITVKVSLCSACDDLFEALEHGKLNLDHDGPEECTICSKKFVLPDHSLEAAYDHELDLDDMLAIILRKIYKEG